MATPIPVNHCAFTLAEVVAATGGRLVGGDPSLCVESVSTDTRALRPGALFVALVGDKHDGHHYVSRAMEAGARAVLVRRGTGTTVPRIEVEDTLVALGRLARFHVDRVRAVRRVPSIAITGSAGKTTTKELTAAAVRALFGSTLATQGNLNNLVGVPMTLFTLGDEHAAMVIECGTSAPGEIARLGEIVAPEVSVVLNADAGHTQGLGSVEQVAVEKGALFAAATRMAIGNADDAPSRKQMFRASVPTMMFGESPDADVRLVERTVDRTGRAVLTVALAPSLCAEIDGGTVKVALELLGHAAALNATAALAAAMALKGCSLSREELDRAIAALGTVKALPGRLCPRSIGGALVLDDSYNANPRSVRASLAAAGEVASGLGARLVVVLGDMLELGELSARWHADIGQAVARQGAAVFVAVGAEMVRAAQAARETGRKELQVVETPDSEQAATVVRDILCPGDVVLVKGSRGMRMERVIEALEETVPSRAKEGEGR